MHGSMSAESSSPIRGARSQAHTTHIGSRTTARRHFAGEAHRACSAFTHEGPRSCSRVIAADSSPAIHGHRCTDADRELRRSQGTRSATVRRGPRTGRPGATRFNGSGRTRVPCSGFEHGSMSAESNRPIRGARSQARTTPVDSPATAHGQFRGGIHRACSARTCEAGVLPPAHCPPNQDP